MVKEGIRTISNIAKKSGTRTGNGYSHEVEYNGVYSLQGVIVNSRKEIDGEFGIESNKLKNNQTI